MMSQYDNRLPMDLPTASRITHFIGQIERGLEKVEPVFLQLGSDLQNIHANAASLSNRIEQSANELEHSEETGFVKTIETTANALLKELDADREQLASHTARMTRSKVEIDKLFDICTHLSKTSRFLNVVGMNIDVESCRSHEAETMFQGFGREVKELAGNMGDTAARIQSDAETALACFQLNHGGRSADLETLTQLSHHAKIAVLKALERLERLTDISGKNLQKAAHHSDEIRHRVGEIVMGIQFHDIIRQKLEHVVTSFQQSHDYLEALQSSVDDGKEEKEMRCYSILAVQSAQLDHIISELQTVFNDLENAFEIIGSTTDNLMNEVGGSRQSDIVHGETDELQQQLLLIKKELQQLLTLETDARTMAGQMQTGLNQAFTTLTRLSTHSDHVGEINTSLQYKALNAIIMANRLGDQGKTLEILATEVKDIAMESDELMKQIMQILRKSSDISDSPGTPHDPGDSDGAAHSIDDTASQSLEAVLGTIADASQRFGEHARGALVQSGSLTREISECRRSLSFILEWAEELKKITDEMTPHLSSTKSRIAGLTKSDDALKQVFDEIFSQYTMESERLIYRQALGDSADETDKSALSPHDTDSSKQTDSDEKNDFDDDNIELF